MSASPVPQPVDNIDPELLTTEQVIERLFACPKLRSMSTMCVLPAVRVENEWRFRRKELETWIAKQNDEFGW